MNFTDKPVLVAGDLMRDIVVHPKGEMRRGSDQAADIRIVAGGSAANQAAWLAHFGVPVALLSRVGADDIQALAAELRGFGIESLLVADPDAHSGKLVCIVDKDGERSFYSDRGASLKLCKADAETLDLSRFGQVCLSGYLFFSPAGRELGIHLIEQCARLGIPLLLDPSSVGFLQDMGIESFLMAAEGAAYLLPNEDEARVLTGFDDRWAQLKHLRERFANVIIKCGRAGAIADLEGERFTVPSPELDVIDTTGAGDAFLAGFLAALRAGDPAPLALDRAARAGAGACMVAGGRPVF